MAPRDIPRHAEMVRAVLAMLGPRSILRLRVMLRALGLTRSEAEDVIVFGLAARMFEATPADASMLRVWLGLG